MKYALNLSEDGRILSATLEKYAPSGAVLVDELPDGNITDYLYQDGAYVYDPVPEPDTAEADARAERDRLLAETDWTQTLDAPITAACQAAFRAYRQALRDVPQQSGFPTDIAWPVMPEVVKLEVTE